MRNRTNVWLALALAVPALALMPGSGVAAPLRVQPAELTAQEHQLPNGLKVLLHEDHSVPVAALTIWYHVGSKNEKPGRSGFAHLFEHMMFKGSENVPSGEFQDYVSSIGGRFNATTDFDRTLYFDLIPSNHLERMLWMEADRMRALDVSEANFVSERSVVKEERRQRVDNPPYGRLLEVVLAKTFTTHPYKILSIGSMADLDSATIADVRDFHQTYYVPNNATIVLAGDFDSKQALGWIEKYFGPIPKGKEISREIAQEPAQTAERRGVDYNATTPLPGVVLTYHVPGDGHPDLYALEVASRILSQGQSSRLYRKMVYDQQIALAADGQTITLEDPGVFFFFTVLQQGHTAEEGEKALLEEIERLKAEPVTAEELDKARNQIIAGLVYNLETVNAKAEALGHSEVILGDWRLANQKLAKFQNVTAADVQAAARKYFRPENRTVIYMLPESLRPADEVKK